MAARRSSLLRLAPPIVLGLSVLSVGARANDGEDLFRHSAYSNHRLVSDGSIQADFPDPNLINGWGVAFNPNGPVWVSANGSGTSTLYDGTGKPQPLVVTIPGADGAQGKPTGIVFAGGNDFVVSTSTPAGNVSGPARFIFATEDGTLAAWAPNVNPTAAITVPTPTTGAIYKGLALSGDGTTHLLYATDFHDNRIDVFDGAFQPVQKPGAFTDPDLPAGYAPFGIQAINGDLYVTYARQDEDAEDDVTGQGFGFVDVYDPEGNLLGRFASGGVLNAPWGIALAPASFGDFGGAILIGNFGDGTINAFAPLTGRFLGSLRDERQRRIRIDGLWGIAFGNGVAAQKTNSLFYAAGPNDEGNGAYGVISPVTRRMQPATE